VKNLLTEKIKFALATSGLISKPDLDALDVEFEKPANEKFGDLSTNVAMKLAKTLKKNPRQIATDILTHLQYDDTEIEKVEIAGAGFINFSWSKAFVKAQLKAILKEKENFGKLTIGKGKLAMVESLSANPTGPLTIGRGRGGVLGDTLANVLEAAGYDVKREYYFNNAGRQMRLLGESVLTRYLELVGEQLEFPQDYYQGEYIRDIARKIADADGASHKTDDWKFFKDKAEAEIFASIKATCKRMGIVYDEFFNENTLYEKAANGKAKINEVIDALREKGFIEEREGAVWFLTTKLGMEKDKVLIKSTGEPSYRLPDIAYHINKLTRVVNGKTFDLIVNVFGADHIDEYPDVLRGLKALGYDETKINVVITQFVTTTVGGEIVKMSTRKGNADTLDDLMDEVGQGDPQRGADIVRFFFLMRNKESHLNFDIELAKKQSNDNPVFYLQYAHARIASIIRLAETEKSFSFNDADIERLDFTKDEELNLIKKLAALPEWISETLKAYEPNRLIGYLNEVAEAFHKFYHECRVIGEEESVMRSRLYLCLATKQVLKNGFRILGISAPERM
jgi:arginyl-tRNA synthetase